MPCKSLNTNVDACIKQTDARLSGGALGARSKKHPSHLPHPPPLSQPWIPPPSVCFIPCCAVSRCWNDIHKKERWRFLFSLKKKKKKAFLSFYLPSPTLYNPLRAFSSKSNLAHVTIHPYPRLSPHSSSPHFSLSPLPRFTSGCHLSLPSFALSVGGDMKGYLCADSRGRRRAELINSLSGADC